MRYLGVMMVIWALAVASILHHSRFINDRAVKMRHFKHKDRVRVWKSVSNQPPPQQNPYHQQHLAHESANHSRSPAGKPR